MKSLIRIFFVAIAPITLTLNDPACSASIAETSHVRLDGIAASDALGESASGIGDVNGDGFSDVAAGTQSSAGNGSSSGAVYVLFGRANGPLVIRGDQLDGTNGFTFRGNLDDRVGGSIGSFDINTDGKQDLVTAGHGAPNSTNAGMVGIVFGAATLPPTVYFPNLNGTTGFRILGTSNSVL